jgi:hypothetical protein
VQLGPLCVWRLLNARLLLFEEEWLQRLDAAAQTSFAQQLMALLPPHDDAVIAAPTIAPVAAAAADGDGQQQKHGPTSGGGDAAAAAAFAELAAALLRCGFRERHAEGGAVEPTAAAAAAAAARRVVSVLTLSPSQVCVTPRHAQSYSLIAYAGWQLGDGLPEMGDGSGQDFTLYICIPRRLETPRAQTQPQCRPRVSQTDALIRATHPPAQEPRAALVRVAAAVRPAAWAQRFLLQLLRDALASPEPPPPPALSQLLHALDVDTVAAAAEAAVQWPVRNPNPKERHRRDKVRGVSTEEALCLAFNFHRRGSLVASMTMEQRSCETPSLYD